MSPPERPTVLITGATDGLGRATAARLAELGARVLVHGRSRERAGCVAAEIGDASHPGRAQTFVADLSSLEEVHRLADEVEQVVDCLDVLVNNAGIIANRRELSANGHELTFAVNHLSHFLLTLRMMPLLRRSAPARIVNVSSIGQAAIDFDDPMLARRYDAFRAYGQSKLAQIMFTFELAARLREEGEVGVTVTAVHPATLMDTKIVRETFGRARSTVDEGVEAVVRLAVSDEVAGITGRFFDGKREAGVDPLALDLAARRRLWDLSESLTR
jgi:NAD(P)-dependent dehydrogenase (short-subunit alcohol dehydrogenase family)